MYWQPRPCCLWMSPTQMFDALPLRKYNWGPSERSRCELLPRHGCFVSETSLLHKPRTQLVLLDSLNPTLLGQASVSLNAVEGTLPEDFAESLAGILCHMHSAFPVRWYYENVCLRAGGSFHTAGFVSHIFFPHSLNSRNNLAPFCSRSFIHVVTYNCVFSCQLATHYNPM